MTTWGSPRPQKRATHVCTSTPYQVMPPNSKLARFNSGQSWGGDLRNVSSPQNQDVTLRVLKVLRVECCLLSSSFVFRRRLSLLPMLWGSLSIGGYVFGVRKHTGTGPGKRCSVCKGRDAACVYVDARHDIRTRLMPCGVCPSNALSLFA